MELTLVLPDLVWPREALAEESLRLPGLQELLSQCEDISVWPEGRESLLCSFFGVPRQSDWPAAPLLAADDGARVEDGFWLCADPLTLDADRDTVRVRGQARYSEAETAALMATLNEHFAEEGVSLLAPDLTRAPLHWYARCERPVEASTASFSQLARMPLFDAMPRGRDARLLRRWMNEAQMLLHEHAVNHVREAEGMPVLNGIWLWGGGQPFMPGTAAFDSACGEDRMLAALCSAYGVPRRRAASASELLSAGSGKTLLLLPSAVPYSTEALRQLDQEWLQPLAEGLRKSILSSLWLAAGGSYDDSSQWRVTRCARGRRSLREWFRRRPMLTEFMERLRRSPS